MRRPWPLLLLLFALFVATCVWFTFQRVPAGKDTPDYSVYSNDRKGLAGTALLLRQLDYEPVALTRPIQNTRYRGLLIMVEPGYHGSAAEIEDDQAKRI